jgi:diaminopimelate decarboxylase
VYNERIFREKCRDMVRLCKYPNFRVNYAIKANTNIALMAIAREEGLAADISSQGEAIAAIAAGFDYNKMFFIVNNMCANEMRYAVNAGMMISVDSLSQLELFCRLSPGGEVALRINSGIGGGHHEKVITGGDGTKFGIMPALIPQAQAIATAHGVKIVGINHHIGSQNMGDLFIQGAHEMLRIAKNFPQLKLIDLGGGFAIPYNKMGGEQGMDLQAFGRELDAFMYEAAREIGHELEFMIEPGRYIVAECGVLLGTVHAVKTVGSKVYVGTDMGFSVLARPTLYDAHHDIEIYRESGDFGAPIAQNIVGNQCESGDYIARERMLPPLTEGDILGVLDAGAYGYSMACTYNHRPRPAEILLTESGETRLIRRADTFDDMLANMRGL